MYWLLVTRNWVWGDVFVFSYCYLFYFVVLEMELRAWHIETKCLVIPPSPRSLVIVELRVRHNERLIISFLPPPSCSVHIVSILHPSGTWIATNETSLTCHCHTQPTDYNRCWTSENDTQSFWYQVTSFLCSKKSSVPDPVIPPSPPPPSPKPEWLRLFSCFHHSAFSSKPESWSQTIEGLFQISFVST